MGGIMKLVIYLPSFSQHMTRTCAFAWLFIAQTSVWAQFDFEKPPVNYGEAASHDRVAALATAIEKGEVQFKYDSAHGWLPDVLKHLQVSEESQVLVFSKTSLQLHKISPRTPRALYFNDDVYVGWCQQGDVVELAATDPELGAVFYTMDQQADDPPRIVRDRGQCLTCHATARTQGVPGYLIRSVYPDINGRPRTGSRTFVTDHSSPFEQRWGGWYVTGSHGQMRHLGNVRSSDRTDPESMDVDAGANQQTLDKLINTDPYLTQHSDLIALLVLEHQSQMHNLIARASMEARTANHYDRGINEALGRPLDTVSESTTRRINSASEALVRYMFFTDEVELANPICGTSKFAEQFIASAKLDQQGRSLRELDLKHHLLKYPCSYLIYSEAFDRMPQPVMDYVKRRTTEVLLAKEVPAGYERLTNAQRAAIAEILRATKPGFLL
jgi:hypothetical protein